MPVAVNLSTDTATGVGRGIANIRNVRGGQGGDTLTGDAQGNVLIGGAGPNTIVGGTGRSLLIGGPGKDTITGHSGGDILIAGSTDFDSSGLAHDQALVAILAEWQSANPYASRINHLETGGGLNGSNELVWGVTVHDNAASDADKLTGGAGGQNWFFANLAHTATNKKAGEQLNC
jgi:Ca2+-binding RTX toxin-like protein